MVLAVTEEVLQIQDVAELLGVSKQAIWDRYQRGTMPEPDYQTPKGRPLWKESTLRKAGVLNGP